MGSWGGTQVREGGSTRITLRRHDAAIWGSSMLKCLEIGPYLATLRRRGKQAILRPDPVRGEAGGDPMENRTP
jgi:hypothetical protein